MILIDRVNWAAEGWSHVLSSSNDVEELDRFRRRIGAPKSSLQLPPRHDPPHLDVCRGPRSRALAAGGPDVVIFETSLAMVREHRRRAAERAASVAEGGQWPTLEGTSAEPLAEVRA